MIEHYTLENKPKFNYGDPVIVDMAVMNGEGLLPGIIVGKGMEHVLDFWLVQFNQDFGPTYPFRVLQVIHTAFVKKTPMDEFVTEMER